MTEESRTKVEPVQDPVDGIKNDGATLLSKSFNRLEAFEDLRDSDNNPISFNKYYKIRFADGSELSLNSAGTASAPWSATAGPPNSGPLVYFVNDGTDDTKNANVCLGSYFTWPSSNATSGLFLSMDPNGDTLGWYENLTGERIALQMMPGTTRMLMCATYASNQITAGLRITGNVLYKSTVVYNGYRMPLECQFVAMSI